MSRRAQDRSAEAVLEERAKRYARALDAREETVAVAMFARVRQVFAVELASLRRCLGAQALFEIPSAPPSFVGTVPLEGRPVSVVDLAALFDLPRSGAIDVKVVLVLEDRGRLLGVAGERALGLRDVPRSAIRPAPSPRPGLAEVFADGSGLVQLLDVRALLADRRLDGGAA